MSSFAEKKAAARNATRSHKDVTVALDTGLSAERDALIAEVTEAAKELHAAEALANSDPRLSMKADLKAPKKRLADAQAKATELNERERDTMVVLRFYRLPGNEWADLTGTNPVRDNSDVDRRYGYNMHAVCRAAAAHVSEGFAFGRILEGDEELSQSPTEWDELWDLLGGADFASVCDAIYDLNEWEPSLRVERLKNSSEVATASDKK